MTEGLPDVETLRALLAAVPDAVVLVGEDRIVRFLNRQVGGYDPGSAPGTDALEAVPAEVLVERDRAIGRALETLQTVEIEDNELIGADGSRDWYDSSLIPLVVDGRAEHVVIVSRRVTERVLASRERDLLAGMVPVCAWCERIRTPDGEWRTLEGYVEATSETDIEHGTCPDCASRSTSGKE